MSHPNPHADAAVFSAGVPLGEAAAVVLLLHGRGGSAPDILSLAPQLDPGSTPRLAFRALQAAGRSWYPGSFLLPRERNEPALSSALAAVHRTLGGLADAAPTRPLAVLGFSQGACLAAEAVLHRPGGVPAPAGLVCLTGGLIGETVRTPDPAEAEPDLAVMQVLLTGGDPDPHVPWSRIEETAAAFRARGAAVEARRFPGKPHGVTPEELRLATALLAGLPEV